MKRTAIARSSTEMRRTPMKKAGTSPTDFPKSAKEAIARRSGGRCEASWAPDCTGRGEVFHHILLRSQGGKGTADNGAHLCNPCHTHVHANPAQSYLRGLMRRSGT